MKSRIKRLVPPPLYRLGCRGVDRIGEAAFFCASIGGRMTCPFCGLRFRRFRRFPGADSPLFVRERVVGGSPFEHSECPWCGSFERERHVYLFLRDVMGVFARPLRLLHVAPERNLQEQMRRATRLRYVRADLTPREVDLACDLTRMPLPSNSFDAIVCNHVLEHIPDDRAAMRELLRVLKPGAWALLQVPLAVSRATTDEDLSVATDAERLRRYGQRDHVRLYGRDYANRLTAAGFQVELHDTRARLGDDYVRRYALIPDEVMYVARKPA